MKKVILILFILVSAAFAASAQTEDLTLRAGQKGHAARGKLEIRFVKLVEDSRCPVGAVCVWAGNAKVKIEVAVRRQPRKTIELNTGLEPHVAEIDGYKIRLIDVTPKPGESSRGRKPAPTIVVSISKT